MDGNKDATGANEVPKPQKLMIFPIAWVAVSAPAEVIDQLRDQARADGAGDAAYFLPALGAGIVTLRSCWAVQQFKKQAKKP